MAISYRKRTQKRSRKMNRKRLTKKKRTQRTRRAKIQQKGGKYNERQKKALRNKFREFGFDDLEIKTFLVKMDDTSQLFGLKFEAILEQLDLYHRRYPPHSEEQKAAVREWVDELSKLDDMVDTDIETE